MVQIAEAIDMRIAIPVAIGGDLYHAEGGEYAREGRPVGLPHGPLGGFGGADQRVDGIGGLVGGIGTLVGGMCGWFDGMRRLVDGMYGLGGKACRKKEQQR